VERFIEPALLLLLRERPVHGYELLDLIPEAVGEHGRVDLGNLYRVLRALEDDGIVTSEWVSEAPGPAKRTYRLTEAGERLLDRWAESLREAQALIQRFLERYERTEGR
jgi:poly-beta-hydroxybutyrate-responsive repressor